MQEYSQVNEYISVVCSQIRSKRAHRAVAREISEHIEDQKNAFVMKGLSDKESVREAVKEMGDPVEVGEQLDRVHRPRPEKSIIAAVILSIFLQLAAVSLYRPVNFELNEYILSIIAGIAAMTVIYFIDYSRVVKYSVYIYAVLAAFGILSGSRVIAFHKVGVSLGYYISLLMTVMYSAILISLKSKGYKGYAACILLLLLGIFTMTKTGSISSLIIFFIGTGVLLLTACVKNIFNINKKIMFSVIACISFTFGVFALLELRLGNNYLYDRIISVFDPYSHADGAGYVSVLIRSLLTGSSLIGEALLPDGYSIYSLSEVLPGGATDYQLTYFIAKFGYIVLITVIFIIVFLTARMFISTFKQKNQQGMFISLGCSTVILIQSIFYISSNLGYEIFGTISLPLLSYGKAGFIANMMIIGLMLCTYRNDALLESK